MKAPGEVATAKKVLRAHIQGERDAIPPQVRHELSARVGTLLSDTPEFRAARTIFFFISFRSEVSTEPMIRQALSEGKRICLPYTYPETRGMIASQITDFDDDLEPGNYGILEPRADKVRDVPPRELDLIITPGVAFDETGGRLGYGGGYYDRFFAARREDCPLVALAFEMQLVKEVPRDGHDLPVDLIVTERRVIDARRRG
ncbi:MAG: 5-formyltetrahydrofolate cyclo-ligase [Candidatus Geothermincolia bacterium]